MLSNLTAEQKNILHSMEPVLGLAADIAHASISIFIPTGDRKFLHIYRQEKHMANTRYVDRSGRQVRSVEEPLVLRSIMKNIPVKGMRESSLGVFNSLYIYPLRDGWGKCFAAVGFDTVAPNEIMMGQAMDLLRNLKHSVKDNNNYRRMSPSDGMIVVDPDKVIIAANNEARHIFQLMGIKDLIGRRTNAVAINWPLVGMVMETGTAESKEFTMNGMLLHIRVLPVVPVPRGGCAIVILQDITELRKKDEELFIKSVVIKEIHHRVKNNLQTIASLLRLQERRAQSQETKNVLKDCIGRVNSIAIVHEYLSQQDTGLIDVAKVAKGIYQAIISSMLNPEFHLRAKFSADQVYLPSEKATSIALILNELLQNTIEHAFEERQNGVLLVEFKDNQDNYCLTIADDGIGLPPGFDPMRGKSLGLKIIKIMAESDLQGSFTLENKPGGGGAIAKVKIPKAGVEKC